MTPAFSLCNRGPLCEAVRENLQIKSVAISHLRVAPKEEWVYVHPKCERSASQCFRLNRNS